eukprot:Opistho-1_new@74249
MRSLVLLSAALIVFASVALVSAQQALSYGFTYGFIVKVGTGSGDGAGIVTSSNTKTFTLTITSARGTSVKSTAGTRFNPGDAKLMTVQSDIDIGDPIAKVTLCNPYFDDLLSTTGIIVRDQYRQRQYTFNCALKLGGCTWGATFCSPIYCGDCTSPSVGPITA